VITHERIKMDDKNLLTIRELARLYNVSSSTVRRLINSGRLPGKKVGGQWRFDPAEARKAFEDGILAGVDDRSPSSDDLDMNREVPSWCTGVVSKWKRTLQLFLQEERPAHVVVNDRRGAKVWALMKLMEFVWGHNLWHSTAIELIPIEQVKEMFGGRKVLLFDEMMQHGTAMNALRQRLERAGALVTSFVCVRKRSNWTKGLIKEFKAFACEDLEDREFAERAALISRLIAVLNPPLDVDHLVIRGKLNNRVDDLLRKIARWGQVFIVRHNDRENGLKYLSLTLDRPQFIDVSNLSFISPLKATWDGPCKIRIYVDPDTGECFCSFIAFPTFEGTADYWQRAAESLSPFKGRIIQGKLHDHRLDESDASAIRRVYEHICIQVAVKVFSDFVSSGAADDIGVTFRSRAQALDVSQLEATFGMRQADRIKRLVNRILAESSGKRELFSRSIASPVPFLVRGTQDKRWLSDDAFACRMSVLKSVPERNPKNAKPDEMNAPISYKEVLNSSANFTESTVGKVIDYELDYGTIKPENWTEVENHFGAPLLRVGRGFLKGEYDPWFRYDSDTIGEEDQVIQRTMTTGPYVVHKFLTRTGWDFLGRVHFAKIFANLLLDWNERYGGLRIFLEPYKYGPLPKVHLDDVHKKDYDRYLLDLGLIKEEKKSYGSGFRGQLRPEPNPPVQWQTLYDKSNKGTTKSHISGLTRLYSAIQLKCESKRPADPQSSGLTVFHDPLVVLASARNHKAVYICGWYEIKDWLAKGMFLFETIKSLAPLSSRPGRAFLKEMLHDFAEPARLLFDKIQMYQNIPHLRQQIEELEKAGDFDSIYVLLESVDKEPRIDKELPYPVANLEWAQGIMRAFSSMTRQILARCGYDEESSKAQRAEDYLDELLKRCEVLRLLEGDLRDNLPKPGKAVLTVQMADALSKAFVLIRNLLESEERIPDPRTQREINIMRWKRELDLPSRLREIRLPEPYAVAVTDIKNLLGMVRYQCRFGKTFTEAFEMVLGQFKKTLKQVVSLYDGVDLPGITGDSLVLAGADPNALYSCAQHMIKETTWRIASDIKELEDFGLLRIGMAWCDSQLGFGFDFLQAGFIAHKIGDKEGRLPGSISITHHVFEKMDPKLISELEEHKDETTEQGLVYVGEWKRRKFGTR
jgi:excisionase family DNA binding protein